MNKFQTLDELENLNKTTNLIETIREITNTFREENSSEERMYNSITELRRLLKYNESAFKISFDNIHNRLIGKTLENNNNIISNELIIYTLNFLSEVLNYQEDDINNNFPEDWISDLYWSILKYIFHNDERIKNISRKAIYNLSITINNTKKVSVLFDTLEDSNLETCQFIFQMFTEFFKSIDSINLIYLIDWNSIISDINLDYFLNNPQQFLSLKDIFILLKRSLDKDFDEFYDLLNDKNKSVFNQLINENRKN